MPNFNDAKRIGLRATLTNLFLDGKTYITTLFSGTFGAGKSQMMDEMAKAMNDGICSVIEASAVKEGEIPGIPAVLMKDGDKYVEFIKHPKIQAILNLQKYYYNIAKTTGFLNGTCKLLENGDTQYVLNGKTHIIPGPTEIEKIVAGNTNMYEFGEKLPPEIKLQLLKSDTGIKSFILGVDEVNRTPGEVMKEFMNILLTKVINDYKLPWWVFIVAAMNPCDQDSVFSTNDMDAAQIDRFLKIKFVPDPNNWIDYAVDAGLPGEYIAAFASLDGNLQATTGKGYDDTTRDSMKPSFRSHTLAASMYKYRKEVSNSGFFTQEEILQEEDDMRTLFIGKLGESAGTAITSRLRDANRYIDPAKIFTGESSSIDKAIRNKIEGFKGGDITVLCNTTVKFFATQGMKTYYDITLSKSDTEKMRVATNKWNNMIKQLTELTSGDGKNAPLLDNARQTYFAKQTLRKKTEFDDPKYKKWDNTDIFYPLSKAFSQEVINALALTSAIEKNGDLDRK